MKKKVRMEIERERVRARERQGEKETERGRERQTEREIIVKINVYPYLSISPTYNKVGQFISSIYLLKAKLSYNKGRSVSPPVTVSSFP